MVNHIYVVLAITYIIKATGPSWMTSLRPSDNAPMLYPQKHLLQRDTHEAPSGQSWMTSLWLSDNDSDEIPSEAFAPARRSRSPIRTKLDDKPATVNQRLRCDPLKSNSSSEQRSNVLSPLRYSQKLYLRWDTHKSLYFKWEFKNSDFRTKKMTWS